MPYSAENVSVRGRELMKEQRSELKINEVEFDKENPRIKGALEKYGDKINAERIHFALQNSSDAGAKNASGFHRLKVSIMADNGITEPIKVVRKDGRTICIDGNTRLAIYREFANKNHADTHWQTIPAVVLEDASRLDIEKIRVTTHLVGARAWPAYEKAKYLSHLRYEELVAYDDLIALCGGSKADIEMQIDAFDDMNKCYRDRVDDSEFKIDRFSGFVELQNRRIKDAIYDAGFELAHFGDWIHNGNIRNLTDVRDLPKVLRDEEARETFVSGGVNSIKQAVRIVDNKSSERDNEDSIGLNEAGLAALVLALKRKLENMNQLDLDKLKDEQESQNLLEDLSYRLLDTLERVGK